MNSTSNCCLWESVWTSCYLCLCSLSDSRQACLCCSSCSALSCCLLDLHTCKTVASSLSPFHLFGALLLSPQSKTVVSGLSLLFKLFVLLLSPQCKTVVSGSSLLFKLFVLLLSPQCKTVVSGLSLLFKLFGVLMLSPRSKTGVSSLSLARHFLVFLRSLVFLRERLRFCSASSGSIKFSAAPRSDAGLRLSW